MRNLDKCYIIILHERNNMARFWVWAKSEEIKNSKILGHFYKVKSVNIYFFDCRSDLKLKFLLLSYSFLNCSLEIGNSFNLLNSQPPVDSSRTCFSSFCYYWLMVNEINFKSLKTLHYITKFVYKINAYPYGLRKFYSPAKPRPRLFCLCPSFLPKLNNSSLWWQIWNDPVRSVECATTICCAINYKLGGKTLQRQRL